MTARLALTAGFIGTVVAANWAINRYGIVPVGFGLYAPAGVYFAGLAFGIRDALQERGGRRWVMAAIAIGGAVSYIVSGGAAIPGGLMPIAAASGIAFTLSELADLTVYTPLRRNHWPSAVVLSNAVGAVFDSALFLWLAFGSVHNLLGNVIGKTYMTAVALPLVYLARRRRAVSRYPVYAEGT